MSEDKTGGPAFPTMYVDCTDCGYIQGGMSLRDWFAGQALPHACARARYEIDRYGDMAVSDHVSEAVRLAYRIADAMLKERNNV